MKMSSRTRIATCLVAALLLPHSVHAQPTPAREHIAEHHEFVKPIPSLWGHTAGAASNPADLKFLNETIGQFLSGSGK